MKELVDISRLRAIAVIIVVAFHAYGFTFWGTHFCPEVRTKMHDIYAIPFEAILINLAMPLFTFISGYLFKYLLDIGKYATWKDLLWKKTTRILFPFVFWSGVMMLTTNSFDWVRLVTGGYFHLWYLRMLFGCFIIVYAIRKWMSNLSISIVLLSISFATPIIADRTGIVFSQLQGWFCWFILGVYAYLHRNRLSVVLHKYHCDILCVLVFVIGNIFYPTYYGSHSFHGIVLQTMGTLGMWSIFHNMDEVQLEKFNFLAPISKASFGIYIFHAWLLLFMVSTTAKRIFGLEAICLNHPIVFPLCLFVANIGLSYALTWLLQKNKYGRWLVG